MRTMPRDARAFGRTVRRRYRLARALDVSRGLAALRAVDGAIGEVLCDLISGHDFIKDAAGVFACDYCNAPRGAA